MRSSTAGTLSPLPINDRGDFVIRLSAIIAIVFSILMFAGYVANERARQEKMCLRACPTGDIEMRRDQRDTTMCYCRDEHGEWRAIKVIF